MVMSNNTNKQLASLLIEMPFAVNCFQKGAHSITMQFNYNFKYQRLNANDVSLWHKMCLKTF